MNNENLILIQETIEKKFREALNERCDISIYLYYPPEYLSKFVKDYLDIFLIEKAFDEISKESFSISNFTVYKDDKIEIIIEEKDRQIETLEKMITYFSSIEEFEKCLKIKYFLELISNQN